MADIHIHVHDARAADYGSSKDSSVEETMHEFKHGQLHSGSKKGPKVTSRKQAIAIALSQAGKSRDYGTPEGARKAAETRKRGGGGTPNPYGTTRYAHLLHRWEGGGKPLTEGEHREFSVLRREHAAAIMNYLKAQGLLERRREGYRLGRDSATRGFLPG